MQKTIWMALAIAMTTGGLACTLNAQDTVEAITEKFESEKAAALEAYLSNKPEAEDFAAGQSALLGSYLALKKMDKVPSLVNSIYDSSGKDNPQVVFQSLMGPMLAATSASGDSDTAKAFLAKIRKDFASHQAAAQINKALDQIEGQMAAEAKALKVGDTMEIAFKDMAGKDFDLAAMEGKVVLVDFLGNVVWSVCGGDANCDQGL